MATRTLITLIDDLDGSTAEETISFSVEGTDYEIDLNDSNARALREALQPFIAAARTVKPARKTRTTRGSNAEIRAWAKANGIHVADRGAISIQVRARYQAAR